MLIISETTTVVLNNNSLQKTEMTVDEYIRWICLLNAVEVIGKHANKLDTDFNKCASIKSNIIKRYIEEVFPSVRANFILENKLNLS